jgi:hypothetical protein
VSIRLLAGNHRRSGLARRDRDEQDGKPFTFAPLYAHARAVDIKKLRSLGTSHIKCRSDRMSCA